MKGHGKKKKLTKSNCTSGQEYEHQAFDLPSFLALTKNVKIRRNFSLQKTALSNELVPASYILLFVIYFLRTNLLFCSSRGNSNFD